MILLLALPPAWATPGFTTCSLAPPFPVYPAEGDAVSPDVRLLVGDTACGLSELVLEGDDGTQRPLQVARVADGWLLTPESALSVGAWTLSGDLYGQLDPVVSFEVAEDAPEPQLPTSPAAVTVTADRTCGADGLSSWATVEAAFSHESYGVVRIAVRTEAGVVATRDLLPLRTLAWAETIPGGEEACATVSGLTVDGEILWSETETCAEPFDGCPSELREPTGCGCAGAPAGSSGAAAGLAALLLRRRRRWGERSRSPG